MAYFGACSNNCKYLASSVNSWLTKSLMWCANQKSRTQGCCLFLLFFAPNAPFCSVRASYNLFSCSVLPLQRGQLPQLRLPVRAARGRGGGRGRKIYTVARLACPVVYATHFQGSFRSGTCYTLQECGGRSGGRASGTCAAG